MPSRVRWLTGVFLTLAVFLAAEYNVQHPRTGTTLRADIWEDCDNGLCDWGACPWNCEGGDGGSPCDNDGICEYGQGEVDWECGDCPAPEFFECSPANCNDSNPCTDDWCDHSTGFCENSERGNCCTGDGDCDPCDTCQNNQCVVRGECCDDYNCAPDSCHEARCENFRCVETELPEDQKPDECFPVGACCTSDYGFDYTIERDCVGNWHADENYECPSPPTGACCNEDDSCDEEAEEDLCDGEWHEDETCDEACPPTGACCHGLDCTDKEESACTGDDYVFQGTWTACSDEPSPCPGECGDGTKDADGVDDDPDSDWDNEECDDGNDKNGDGCSNECKNEICGDGQQDWSDKNKNGTWDDGEGEECDEGASNTTDASAQSIDEDQEKCRGIACGDGVVNIPTGIAGAGLPGDQGELNWSPAWTDQMIHSNCTSECRRAACSKTQETAQQKTGAALRSYNLFTRASCFNAHYMNREGEFECFPWATQGEQGGFSVGVVDQELSAQRGSPVPLANFAGCSFLQGYNVVNSYFGGTIPIYRELDPAAQTSLLPDNRITETGLHSLLATILIAADPKKENICADGKPGIPLGGLCRVLSDAEQGCDRSARCSLSGLDSNGEILRCDGGKPPICKISSDSNFGYCCERVPTACCPQTIASPHATTGPRDVKCVDQGGHLVYICTIGKRASIVGRPRQVLCIGLQCLNLMMPKMGGGGGGGYSYVNQGGGGGTGGSSAVSSTVPPPSSTSSLQSSTPLSSTASSVSSITPVSSSSSSPASSASSASSPLSSASSASSISSSPASSSVSSVSSASSVSPASSASSVASYSSTIVIVSSASSGWSTSSQSWSWSSTWPISSASPASSASSASSVSSPYCGNGRVEMGEQCDDGNFFNLDGCDRFCRIEIAGRCGNRIIEPPEECDDGNAVNGDGCSTVCTREMGGGWCGNRLLDAGEECDDGNFFAGDGCDPLCNLEPIVSSACGNGMLDPGEECDDGNRIGGDGCTVLCRMESPVGEAVCGNGITEMNEQCDDGNLAEDDGCDASCRRESAVVLVSPFCGNGMADAGEECDDGNTRDLDGCSASCFIEHGRCGDGVVQRALGEECEPDLPDPSAAFACGTDCRYQKIYCGNGLLESGEQCDRGRENAWRADAACRPDCTFGRCGDGIPDSVEQCDDGNLLSGDGCSNRCMKEQGAASSTPLPLSSWPSNLATLVPLEPSTVLTPPPSPEHAPVGNTGPATAAMMAAGAAAGWAWVRRRKGQRN